MNTENADFHALSSAHSTRTISVEGRGQPANRTLVHFARSKTHDLRRGLRRQPPNRPLACISSTRHARSPQRVARAAGKSHSRALDTRNLARGQDKSHSRHAFRALDTHDLRRGLRGQPANRTFACISRTRHARSPQMRGPDKSHSRLHIAHSTRMISAEGCARSRQIALACISRTRRARSPQRVARAAGKSHSRLHFAHSTRTISAEGCARTGQIALSPAFGTLDTHDLRRGLHFG